MSRPPPQPRCGVLQSEGEWRAAAATLAGLHLPRHNDPPKDWDTLIALACVLDRVPVTGRVLDAGAEYYSSLLPALFLYGYRHLFGINLTFSTRRNRGPVCYEPGDLTRTRFPDQYFDAITCLSVIEHGVPLADYFREASRLLRPGGVLITSTDYWQDPVDTGGQLAYGVPIHIFTRAEILDAVALAAGHSLHPVAPVDERTLACRDRAVTWKRFGLEFTFVVFTLEKKTRVAAGTASQPIEKQ